MNLPTHPRVRTLNAIPATQAGRQLVLLEDPLGIADQTLIPPRLTPLLALCDGTRNLSQIQSEFRSAYGIEPSLEDIQEWLEAFSQAGLLDNEIFQSKKQEALNTFRAPGARAMQLAREIYPESKQELTQLFDSYVGQAEASPLEASARGMISPHIDYQRGWRVYANVMEVARHSIQNADLLVVLGTDHFDDGNPLTLTYQNYETPYGILPTAIEMVDSIKNSVPGLDVFRGELRHQFEHSIELALVWLHHMRDGDPCNILPILCGTHDLYLDEGSSLEKPWVEALVGNLGEILKERNALIVAAADLAHVGASFGEPALHPEHRKDVALADERLLQHVKEVNPEAFLDEIIRVDDRYNVCGTTPIYLLLRLLTPSVGNVVSYEICPADQYGTSWVSICGALLR